MKDRKLYIDDIGRVFFFKKPGKKVYHKFEANNVELIESSADLEKNDAGTEYQLKDNTVYRVSGISTIDLPIRLGNNSPIIGGHGATDGFIHTGGQGCLRGTNKGLFLRNLYLHAPGGTLFNVSGDTNTEMLVESCAFSDAAGVGNMASLGTIDGFRVPSFKGCSFEDFDQGISFDGNTDVPDKVFISASPFRSVSASGVTVMSFNGAIAPEVIDITDCYMKGMESDTEIVRVQNGATPSQIFQYRGNTHDNTVNADNILNGQAAVENVGFNITDAAPLRDSTVIGEFNLDSEATTTISSQNTWYQISGAGTLGNETERMQSTGTDGELEYVGRRRKNTFIVISASAKLASNEVYEIAVAKNGTVEPTSITSIEGQGTNKPLSVSTSSIEDLVTGDIISIFVRNTSGTSDATFGSYNFNIVGV